MLSLNSPKLQKPIMPSFTESAPIPRGSAPWRVISSVFRHQNEDLQYWWESTALLVGEMMEKAGYDVHLQYQHLIRYHQYVLPLLGPRPKRDGSAFWKSFMTDDFTPIETSFNFDSGKRLVRLSIEPIGHSAGTILDPFNQAVVAKAVQNLKRFDPNADFQWFNTLVDELFVREENYFKVQEAIPKTEARSQFFVAFDLEKANAGAKAYFMPTLKAIETGTPNLQLTSKVMNRLHSSKTPLKDAYGTIEDYILSQPVEAMPRIEIIATDCVTPTKSRVKLYIRTRYTSFSKVRDVYTLGGRLNDPTTHEGVATLKGLWYSLLSLPADYPEEDELPFTDHRTAGTLFNFELKPGNPLPQPKVYVPVRHYGRSDLDISASLAAFFKQQGWKGPAGSYIEDMQALL
jgi:DMATS type aromatic prenyltransferase